MSCWRFGRDQATAFAPASAANVAIGFDILGFSVDVLGDKVTVERTAKRRRGHHRLHRRGQRHSARSGEEHRGPRAARHAGGAEPGLRFRRVHHKGIPLGSGLGGSAASAVAAVVAANALLDKPLSKIELLKFAMQGETVSSGSLHVDNISPSLFGGLVLTVGIDNPRVKQIPVPEGIRAVLVHPHLFLSTKQARGILKREVTMSDFIWQTANLAGFISGCYTNDLDMIRASFEDVVIEKQRSQLIPGFDAVREGAMAAGALGCTISGAGPTMFAWALETDAEKVRAAMVAAFRAAEHESG